MSNTTNSLQNPNWYIRKFEKGNPYKIRDNIIDSLIFLGVPKEILDIDIPLNISKLVNFLMKNEENIVKIIFEFYEEQVQAILKREGYSSNTIFQMESFLESERFSANAVHNIKRNRQRSKKKGASGLIGQNEAQEFYQKNSFISIFEDFMATKTKMPDYDIIGYQVVPNKINKEIYYRFIDDMKKGYISNFRENFSKLIKKTVEKDGISPYSVAGILKDERNLRICYSISNIFQQLFNDEDEVKRIKREGGCSFYSFEESSIFNTLKGKVEQLVKFSHLDLMDFSKRAKNHEQEAIKLLQLFEQQDICSYIRELGEKEVSRFEGEEVSTISKLLEENPNIMVDLLCWIYEGNGSVIKRCLESGMSTTQILKLWSETEFLKEIKQNSKVIFQYLSRDINTGIEICTRLGILKIHKLFCNDNYSNHIHIIDVLENIGLEKFIAIIGDSESIYACQRNSKRVIYIAQNNSLEEIKTHLEFNSNILKLWTPSSVVLVRSTELCQKLEQIAKNLRAGRNLIEANDEIGYAFGDIFTFITSLGSISAKEDSEYREGANSLIGNVDISQEEADSIIIGMIQMFLGKTRLERNNESRNIIVGKLQRISRGGLPQEEVDSYIADIFEGIGKLIGERGAKLFR